MSLDRALTELKGIGPRRGEQLAEAGLETLDDLLHRLPFRYEDRRAFARVADLAPGGPHASVLVESRGGRVIRTRRRGFSITEVRFRDDTGEVTALWYNQPFLARAFPEGRRVVLFGRPVDRRNRREPFVLENPDHERMDGDEDPGIHTGRIVPVYRGVAGLGTRVLRTLVHRALASLAEADVPDPLPRDLTSSGGVWPTRLDALRSVHFPDDGDVDDLARGQSPAHRRLAVEEMYLLQTALAVARARRRAEPGREPDTSAPERLPELVRAGFPFEPTADQDRVLREIAADLASPSPAGRLLQGDVGSGKTAVAAALLLRAAERGGQGVLLAPTGILAEQHADTLRRAALRAGVATSCVVLTGTLRAAERRERLAAIEDGRAGVVVATHAVLERPVRFRDLRAVVVDEQHRFGVAQRASLLGKGRSPDVLVMTATPIPRSLALTVYGDLDLSVLRERPPGRRPVRTLVRSESARAGVYDGIRREIDRGHQAFVVVPKVDDPGATGLRSAVETARRLASKVFPDRAVGLVHGRLGADVKEETMRRFAAGGIDVLVATTVIEVGIDVPRATVMVVEHAERFGLAQLHQLRGRVGRGEAPGYCVLLVGSDDVGRAARERLEILAATDDGFEVAERDLELRGPGEVFAAQQHGDSDLRFLGPVLREPELLLAARRAAAAAVGDRARLHEAWSALRPGWRRRLGWSAVG